MKGIAEQICSLALAQGLNKDKLETDTYVDSSAKMKKDCR